jgi:hypothetical protein
VLCDAHQSGRARVEYDYSILSPIQNNERRTLALVHDPLSEEMLDQLAGPYGVAYCGDAPAYLLKEVGACKFITHCYRMARIP